MVIDINVTSACNLACTYCSEGFECGLSTAFQENTSVTLDNIDDFISKISDQRKDVYFWGGEPFINWEFCKGVIDKYKHDSGFSFFFYTNGVYLRKYMSELVELGSELGSRLNIQVSYDGKAVNDKTRPDKAGHASSDLVKANYLAAKANGLNVRMKSVLTAENFHLIYYAFRDVIELDENYFPTPDMYSQLSFEEFEPHLHDLKRGLMKIAKYIYDNNLPPEKFGWFQRSRALCSAGIDYMSVDLNGDISPCHGCMYKESDDHVMGNIMDVSINVDDLIKTKSDMFRTSLKDQPLECQSCDAQFCMKCNAATYEKSEHDNYLDKWTDHRANWQVCKVFKLNEEVHHALRVALNNYNPPSKDITAKSCSL